jgi:DNA polymerase elongation subunit (family B)
MQSNKVFPYSWHIDEKERDVTCIRMYGLDESNNSVCIRVDDFTPYAYLELPTHINWTSSNAQLVSSKIDELTGDTRPLKKVLMYKKKLYGAHLDASGNRKVFPFLFCSFSSTGDMKSLGYKVRQPINVVGCGVVNMKMHESDASPILQLTCCRNISTAGWISFHGKEVEADDKLTLCDHEYVVKWKRLNPHESNVIPKPLIMGFDIEVNSHNPSKFPEANEPKDAVFQISCVMSREGDPVEKYESHLLTLGDPDQEMTGSHVKIHRCKTEAVLLEGFANLIREEGPNVIVGYNILGFDIPYLIERAKMHGCFSTFDTQGFHKYKHATERTIKWSSSAFKNQEFQFLDAEGRLYVDLLPLVQNNYKMSNYKLKTVSEYFIGDTKDPLSVQGIFKCYRVGIIKEPDNSYSPRARKAMAICGKYCVQDSALVIRLMEKLKTWPGLTEMAKTCQVPIFSLYTQGQQIRVYSQIYKFCMGENIVVEKDGYVVSEGERYVGAHVFPPVPGRYEKVVPFDFASLYPTTIIAYNIDYHTFVTDPDIPDSKCHVMEWTDCIGCCHDPKVIRVTELTEYINTEQKAIKKLRDKRNTTKGVSGKETIAKLIATAVLELKPYVSERSEINKTKPKFPMCANRRYRFLKEPKGVVPTVLKNLLDARRHTRKVDMKACFTELATLDPETDDVRIKELNSLVDVLDKRQLAYKVSCNSMYGAMGVRRGYLPFMPGAMCIISDSLISFGYGFTRKLGDITSTDSVWSYNNNGQFISNGKGVAYKGKKELVKVTLIDGRTLRCTPDHRIMTSDGWVEAGELLEKHKWDGSSLSTQATYSSVVAGLELPEDIVNEDEKDWTLLDYNMTDKREQTLAFARVLGFILADGSISRYNDKISSAVAIGTMFDAKIFVSDIKLLTGKEPSIHDTVNREEIKGCVFTVSIPTSIVKQIMKLEGIMVGKRTHQPFILPDFVYDLTCPLSVVREFLGGLFGGDGTSPGLSVSHPSFSPVCIGWSTIEKYKSDMVETMNKLIALLSRLGLSFHLSVQRLARVRLGMEPKDIIENPRWEYIITGLTSASLSFAETIGFRYCSDKNNRLTVAASYQRYSDNARKQHIEIMEKASAMKDVSVKEALALVMKNLYKNEIPIHDVASIPTSSDIYRHRSRPHKLDGYKLKSQFFPNASEYAEMVGCKHWFSPVKGGDKLYSIDRYATEIPCISLAVLNVENDGVEDVYDIMDMPAESFIANGVVVHNCTTYMGRVNIEKVAATVTEKFGGELIYGDTDCLVAETPTMIRNSSGVIMYRPVDELSDGNWNRINPNKEISNAVSGYEIWSDSGWTPIVNVVRCGILKPLTKVLTHIGVVECSNEHSLLREDLSPATPLEIQLNDKLCTTELPLPLDTPLLPVFDNSITVDVIRDYLIPDITHDGISAGLAFVWGLFFADGSCGTCDGYSKIDWNINTQDTLLLDRVRKILEVEEPQFDWVSVNLTESSNAWGIYPEMKELKHDGSVGNFTSSWRSLFYDSRGNKKVPDQMLFMPLPIRQAFFMGHYAGDGSKKDPDVTIYNKGSLGSAGLFFIMRSIGYKVSINTQEDKPMIYKLTASNPRQEHRKVPNAVKKILPMVSGSPSEGSRDYIYDIQTGNHHFAAGVGQLVVHNSNYIHFPHLKNATETWDYALYVAAELTKLFPPPIELEFEQEIYDFFFILTKKRYMYRKCLRDGVVDDKIGKKGVLLARRDNSKFVRDVYEGVIIKVADNRPKHEIIQYVLDEITMMCSGCKPIGDFVVTKAVGDSGGLDAKPFENDKGQIKAKVGDYTVPLLPSRNKEPQKYEDELKKKGASSAQEFYLLCLPAQVQLAERMRRRGQRVDNGSRLEYVISDPERHTAKQYEKVESVDYLVKHSDVLRLDYMYYIKALSNPLDQVLSVAFTDIKDFVLNQYNFRFKVRSKVLNELTSLFSPKLEFK